ncbi:hypothetical protein A6035_17160 (plasmid) [Dietzia lutea]|uniref:(S)-ureidoglycine aminohydrolase cupin domain-containing protein n=1 Tax=Dietzia lutea TaxID=546160 RepID=A0A2S1RCT1_9ACTN|nr:hypothetical protein A6035_17160 [Dietzia lutea]
MTYPDARIISGDPAAVGLRLFQSDDGRVASGFARHAPSEVWIELPVDEVLLCLEGHVTITPDEGEPVDVRPGELVWLPAGTNATWRFHETTVDVFNVVKRAQA